MKKYLLLLLIILGSSSLAIAQKQKGEKIQALKIAFLTQRLQLTADEAKTFWPVYNDYESELKKLRMNKSTNSVLENEQKLLNIRKKFNPKFGKILGSERANNLFKAEREFRNILITRLKNRRQQRLH